MTNRPIKFRVLDGERMWYSDDYFMSGQGVLFETVEGRTFKTIRTCPDRDEVFVMQFTGLHDAEGREVYEGDVVVSLDGTRPAVVEWIDSEARFIAVRQDVRTFFYPGFHDSRVIGNIYEHPHLLTPTHPKEEG